jgi:hypothetical protein
VGCPSIPPLELVLPLPLDDAAPLLDPLLEVLPPPLLAAPELPLELPPLLLPLLLPLEDAPLEPLELAPLDAVALEAPLEAGPPVPPVPWCHEPLGRLVSSPPHAAARVRPTMGSTLRRTVRMPRSSCKPRSSWATHARAGKVT